MKARCTHLIAVSLILAAGCASSRLTVKVDVYADDLLVQALSSPNRLVATRLTLEKAGPLATDIAETRKALMGRYEQLYWSYLEMLNAAITDPNQRPDPQGATKAWAKPKQLYDAKIDKRAGVVADRTADALGALDRFAPIAFSAREGTDAFSESEFFNAWHDLSNTHHALNAAFKELTEKDLGTTFEEIAGSVIDNIPADVDKVLTKVPEAVRTEAFGKKLADFNAELEGITTLAKEVTSQADQAMAQLTKSSGLIDQATRATDPQRISQGMTTTMKAAFDVSKGPGPNLSPKARSVIGQIASSYEFMNTQIDRMQDPADPAWRILSAEENQDKWQTYYAETDFYAQGRSDVVFVQDRLGHFRLQRGKNNPTALIQGQFKITRAVASGLVDVLAAAAGATGIPGVSAGVAKIVPASSTPAGPPAEDAVATAANISQDARQQQRIQSAARLRQAFLDQLTELKRRIEEAPENQPLSEELLESLRSTVIGYQRLMASTLEETP